MITWNTYYTGSESDVIAANTQINSNCGFPDAYTQTWAIPTQNYTDPTTWFILMPPPEGYMNGVVTLTQSQMINSVVNVTQAESQSNWWPPSPYPPG
jgi:hypothetical protein